MTDIDEDAELNAALELVDQIDRHQAARAEYHPDHQPAEPDPPHCRECNQPWPCWTMQVAHSAHALGRSQGHIDAAHYVSPGDNKSARNRRLLIMVMTPSTDDAPYPSLDPAEALANPSVPPKAADPEPEEANEEPPAPTRANRPGDVMQGPGRGGVGRHSWSAACERADCVRIGTLSQTPPVGDLDR